MKKFVALLFAVTLMFSAVSPASADDSCWRGRKNSCRVEKGNSNGQIITIVEYTGDPTLRRLIREAADRLEDPTVVNLQVVSGDPADAPNKGWCGGGCKATPGVISVVLAATGEWRFWGDYRNTLDADGFLNGSTVSINRSLDPLKYHRDPLEFPDTWNRSWLLGLLGSALTNVQYFDYACDFVVQGPGGDAQPQFMDQCGIDSLNAIYGSTPQ